MNQSGKDNGRSFVPHHEPAEGLEPRVRPLNDPPALVAPQLTTVLMRRLRVVAPPRDDRLDASPDQQSPQWVAVIAAVGDQAARLAALSAAAPDAPIQEC